MKFKLLFHNPQMLDFFRIAAKKQDHKKLKTGKIWEIPKPWKFPIQVPWHPRSSKARGNDGYGW